MLWECVHSSALGRGSGASVAARFWSGGGSGECSEGLQECVDGGAGAVRRRGGDDGQLGSVARRVRPIKSEHESTRAAWQRARPR